MTSFVLTPAIAQHAVAIVKPAVMNLIESGESKRKTLHVVIAKPRAWGGGFGILHEETLGEADRGSWQGPFDEIARAKCRMSWRLGASSSYVVNCAPESLEMNDTIHWGSAVLDDLVTACSGDHPFFDEMFAGMINHAIRALCKEYVASVTAEKRGSGEHFFNR